MVSRLMAAFVIFTSLCGCSAVTVHEPRIADTVRHMLEAEDAKNPNHRYLDGYTARNR